MLLNFHRINHSSLLLTLFICVYIDAEATTTMEYYGYDNETQLVVNTSKASDNTPVIVLW